MELHSLETKELFVLTIDSRPAGISGSLSPLFEKFELLFDKATNYCFVDEQVNIRGSYTAAARIIKSGRPYINSVFIGQHTFVFRIERAPIVAVDAATNEYLKSLIDLQKQIENEQA